MIPLILTMISSEGEQWGRYNLPRYVFCQLTEIFIFWGPLQLRRVRQMLHIQGDLLHGAGEARTLPGHGAMARCAKWSPRKDVMVLIPTGNLMGFHGI